MQIHNQKEDLETIRAEVDLVKKLHALERENKKLNEELDNTKHYLATVKEHYMNLLEKHELEKVDCLKRIEELEKHIEEYRKPKKNTKVEQTNLNQKIQQNNKPKLLEKIREDYERKIANLKATITEMRRKEEEIYIEAEKKRLDNREWFGEQIILLEADRDMYYFQCCSLQEEIANINQEYKKCIEEKDKAIEEMKVNLDSALHSINLLNSKFSEECFEKKKIWDLLRNRDDRILQLQKQLEIMDKENTLIWKNLDQELLELQAKLHSAKEISIVERSILFEAIPSTPLASCKTKPLDMDQNALKNETLNGQRCHSIVHPFSPMSNANNLSLSLYGTPGVRIQSSAIIEMDLKTKNLEKENQLLKDKVEELELKSRQIAGQIPLKEAQITSNKRKDVTEYKAKYRKLKEEVFMLRAQFDWFSKERSVYERKLVAMIDEKQEAELRLFLSNK